MSAAADRAPYSQGPTKKTKKNKKKKREREREREKRKEKEKLLGTRSKGPSGITGGGGSGPPLFSFHFLKPLKFVLGVLKWNYYWEKGISRPGKMSLKGPTVSC